jgi:cardiolipin synthase
VDGIDDTDTMLQAIWPVAVITAEFLFRIALIAFILLRRRRRADSNLAWIVLILAVPLLGAVAYLLVGEARLSRRRTRRHAAIVAELGAGPVLDRQTMEARRPSITERYKPLAVLAEAVGRHHAVGGNVVRLIGRSKEMIDSLVADIDAAERFCHLLFYIYLDDGSGQKVAAALMRAARRDVACRLLVDGVGSRPFLRSGLRREMEAAGVRVVAALRANLIRAIFARIDLRNHRKIAVIDGRIAYTGSQNIADAAFAPKPRFAPWVDAGVRVEGPVIKDLHRLFAEDWYLDTGEKIEDELKTRAPTAEDGITTQVMGTGPNYHNEALRQLLLLAITTAREELVLTTPYFVPDDATAIALRMAAGRGVSTALIVPARNDSPLVAAASRSQYEALLDAGVEIHEFRGGLLHAKTLTIDRELAMIMTANLDRRSFDLNFEASLVVYDTDFASELRFLQTSYLSRSDAIDPGRWRGRPWPVKLWHNTAGTLGPVL